MLAANYPTKKSLKAAIGQALRYQETTIFGNPEYKPNGNLTVVGPSAHERKWFANVTMADGLIKKVS